MIDVAWYGRAGARRSLLGALAVSTVLACSPAFAADSYDLDLPSAPLDQTLVRFGERTRQQVFFRKSLVAGRTAPPLRGRYTAEEALAALLADTNLSVS